MGLVKKLKKTSKFIGQMFSSKFPRIAYTGGWQGHLNLGDEAIYAALRQLFHKFNFIEYNKNAVPPSLLKFFPPCQAALLGGGTIIGDKESSILWAKNCFASSSHRIVFGSGVVDPDFVAERSGLPPRDIHNRMWKEILDDFEYIGVRGPLSAKLLSDWGVANVEVIGDPVLALSRNRMPDSASVTPKSIGLNIGCLKGNVWGTQEHVSKQYIKLAAIAKTEGWSVKWFAVWPEDADITEKAAVASRTTENIYKIYEDYHSYTDLVSPLSIFVGMKLHAVILATCAYIPSVMLAYQPKCRDYMLSIEQDKNTIRLDHFEAEDVWEIVTNLNSQRESVSKSLFQAIKPLRELQILRSVQIMENCLLKN